MATTDVIKMVMARKNIQRAEVAAALGMSPEAWGAKVVRKSFSLDDAIRVGDALGVRLAFIDDDGSIYAFKPSDAAPPRHSGKKKTSED